MGMFVYSRWNKAIMEGKLMELKDPRMKNIAKIGRDKYWKYKINWMTIHGKHNEVLRNLQSELKKRCRISGMNMNRKD